MKLTEKTSLAFAAYGLFYGVMLAVTVTVAFYVVEDAIFDFLLVRAVEHVRQSVGHGAEPLLPEGMTLYADDVPEEFATLPEGRHEVAEYKHVAVFPDPSDGGYFYLVADQTAAGLDAVLRRILYGTLLTLVAAVVVGLFVARLLSRQLMRPMRHLVERIDRLDIENPSLQPLPHDDEVGFLSEKFSKAVDLLKGHDLRERNFTRFASHELRTPITVVRGTLSILRTEPSLSLRAGRALSRAEDAAERMSRLVEAFLFLGRKSDDGMPTVITAQQVANEVDSLAKSRESAGDGLDLVCVVQQGEFVTNLLLLSIVLDNLIVNALRHGTGELTVEIASPIIRLRNRIANRSGPGHGFGLEIAQRLCERIGFHLTTAHEADMFLVSLRNTRSESVL